MNNPLILIFSNKVFRGFPQVIVGVLGLFLVYASNVSATHLVGGDLTYQKLGPLEYEITLNYYFDCGGNRNAFTPHPEVKLRSNCTRLRSIKLDAINNTGKDIAPICNKYQSSCNGGNKKGIEKYVFRDTVHLSKKCSNWTFYWFQNARNKAITTISQPGNESLYLETTLNNKKFPDNSSPYFTNDPVAFLCNNQKYIYNHGAKDPDGDSLVYSFYKPKTSRNQTVNYIPAYSHDQPIKSSPKADINPQTGNITLHPVEKDITVLGVKVKEYDTSGQLKGVILRDIQVHVKDCTSSNAPRLTGFTPYYDGFDATNKNQDTTVCPGQPLELFVGAKDPDPQDSLYMSWNKAIQGGKFKVIDDSTNSPVGKLTWTAENPSSGFKTRRYSFTVNVRDNNCPYYTNIVNGYAIDVIPSKQVDLGNDTVYVACDDSLKLSPLLKGADSNYNLQWNTGQAKDSIWVKKPGKYWVSVSDSSDCSITDTIVVLPSLNPDYAISPSFSANRGCINDTTEFYDSSTSEKSTVNSWLWHFGDGDSTKVRNPRHQYEDTGNYQVELIIQDNKGCQDTLNKNIAIDPKPRAKFENNLACTRNKTTFTDKSQIANGTIPLNFWKFGDGTYDTSTHPKHVYQNHGQFKVRQIAESGGGCRDTSFQTIEVNPTSKTHFSAKGLCKNQNTQFKDTSGIAGAGSITAYNWKFGNGKTSSGPNPVVKFGKANTYPVRLTTVSEKGCKDTLKKPLRIFNPPQLNISGDSLFCKGDSVRVKTKIHIKRLNILKDNFGNNAFSHRWDTFYNGRISRQCGSVDNDALRFSGNNRREAITDNLNVKAGGNISFYIKFGDGTNQCDKPEVNEGVYLEYSVDNGNTWQSIKKINYSQYSKFTKLNFPIPLNAQTKSTKFRWKQKKFSKCSNGNCLDNWAIDKVNISVKPDFQYTWSPQKGISEPNVKEPRLAPNKARTYVLRLKEKRKQCTVKDSIALKKPRVINPGFISSAPECSRYPVELKDTSKINNGIIRSRKWDLGDGHQSTKKHLNHEYQDSGDYKVQLTTTSMIGCRDSINKILNIKGRPNSRFFYDTSCENNLTHFTNRSRVNSNQTIQWKWNFDDKDTSTRKNPTYRFPQNGKHPVSLIAKYRNDCFDTFTKEVKVKSKPKAAFQVLDTIQCIANNAFNFRNESKKNNANPDYLWDYDNQDTLKQKNPHYTYDTFGHYQVRLLAKGENGCKDSTSREIKVAPRPQAAFNNTRSCLEENLRLKDDATIPQGGINSWFYNFGDGDTSANRNPVHHYQEAGTYPVKQIATSVHGCRDSISKTIYVYGNPGISNIKRVSVKNDENILIEWDSIPTRNPGHFVLERAEGLKGFQKIAELPENTLAHVDKNVNVDDTFYTYRIQIRDSCGHIGGYSEQKGTSIKLSVNEGKGEPTLNWTPYRGWPVDYYEVQKKSLKNGNFNTIPGYGKIPADSLSLIDKKTGNTIKKRCYRIIGHKQNQATVYSISNTTCLDRKMRIYVPSAFSPNGDGINDKLGVKGTYVVNYWIKIYNRWGEKIYEGNSMNEKWDGKYKGEKVETGPYLYILWAEGPNGESRKISGQIKVLR